MTDYGRDISCAGELKTGVYATGVRLVAEAAYRRLITRKGQLPGSPDYGFDIAGYVGATSSASELAALPGLVRQEILKDGRLRSADITTSTTTANNEMTLTIEITGYTDAGPFELVLEVDDVTVTLVGLEASS